MLDTSFANLNVLSGNGTMKRIRVKAIILGLLAEMVLIFLVELVICALVYVYALSKNIATDPISFAEMLKTPACFLITAFLQGIATVAAGFITGWIARQNRVFNGSLMAAITVGLSVAIIPFSNPIPLWLILISVLFTLLGGAVGGLWAEKALGTNVE